MIWRLSILAYLVLALPASAELLDPLAFASLGGFDTTAGGSFTIDTDALTITNDAAPGTPLFTGVIDDQGGLADSYGPGGAVTTVGPAGIPHIAVFTFDDLQLGSASSFTVTGHRALALLSRGDATIDTALRLNGEPPTGSGSVGFEPTVTPLRRGGPGGFAGGGSLGPNVVPESGHGASGGEGSYDEHTIAYTTQLDGADGSHRNAGSDAICAGDGCGQPSPTILGSAGVPSTDSVLEVLRGGSGGGATQAFLRGWELEYTATGAGGGGAIEIGAVGVLTLGPSGVVDASAVPPTTSYDRNWLGFSAVGLSIQGGRGAGGGVRLHADRLVNLGSDNISARGRHGTGATSGFAGGSILLRGLDQALILGQSSLSPGDFGALPGNGLFSVDLATARILAGESLELSSQTVLQAQTATLPRIELSVQDVEIADAGTATVPAGGFTSRHEIRLSGPDALLSGTGTLTNAGVLRGEGTVMAPVDNTGGGRVDVSNESLALTQGLVNQAGGRVNVVAGTLTLPGDGLSNDDGLVNLGTLNLVDATVAGDVRSPAGSTINVAGDVVFEGLVSGAGSFSGTQNLVVFEGGYSPGD